MDEALPKRFGKYTLIKKLATGGMAELFLALHRSVAGFEKLIVIKMILPSLSADQSFITMFLSEARIAATLNHPNVVQIFDVGSVGDTYFIAMEYIHGEDLRTIVRAMRKQGLPEFPLEKSVAIGLGMLAGLAYAHERKNFDGEPLHLVHRDISPQNIIVTFTGDLKVVDFGIAKTGLGSEDTKAGQLKGKVPYMSPEQCRAEPLDARSDIFSAGIILYELTTNRRLFRTPSEFQTLRLIVEGEYPNPSTIRPDYPLALEAIVMKALVKDRDERYQTAREFMEDLEHFAREEKMKVGATALASFMARLFGDKLAAQQEALQAGRQLAEIIAAQEVDRGSSPGGRTSELLMLSDPDFEETATPSTAAGTPLAKSAAGRGPETRAWMAEKQKSGSRRLVVASLAALLVAAAIGGTLAVSNYGRTDPSRDSRATGSIEVTSVPPGAAIKLNGEVTAWRTPYRIAHLPVGTTYDVRLVLDGYEPFTENVSLRGDERERDVRAQLRRQTAASLAVVRVATIPPGARLILDGTDTNLRSPATVTGVQPGMEHVLLVQREGYVDKQLPLSLAASQVADLNLTLERTPLGPDEVLLTLTADPVDSTLIVGKISYTTGSPYEVRVAAGRRVSIAVTHSGYTPDRREIQGRAGQTLPLDVRLTREERPTKGGGGGGSGTLVLDSRPWCNVTIDGVARGQTPVVNLSLSSGRHSGRCVNPQFGINAPFSVTIAPGETTRKRLTHETP